MDKFQTKPNQIVINSYFTLGMEESYGIGAPFQRIDFVRL